MFREVINETVLTTDIANETFANIIGDSIDGDYSFLTTMRALLCSRLKEDESVAFSYNRQSPSVRYISGRSPEGCFEYIISPEFVRTQKNTLSLINIASVVNGTYDYQWADYIEAHAAEVFPDFYRVKKITDFYQKAFRALCYVNPNIKSTVVFVFNVDTRRLHFLQCSIPAMLPWFFEEQKLSPEEMALLNTLNQKDVNKYYQWINDFASRFNFREAHIRKQLAGFETTYERKRMEEVTRQIGRIMSDIDSHNRAIANLIMNKRSCCIELSGLRDKIAQSSGESDIMKYFLGNDMLVLHRVTGETIEFGVKDYLEYFDEDRARRYIPMEHGMIEECHSGDISISDMRKLMTAIFIDQTLKVRMCARYSFSLTGNVQGLQDGYNVEYDGYMPNPHIIRYGCMGDNVNEVNTRVSNGLYIGAIEQCIASCRSVDFDDPSMSRFIERLYAEDLQCIELPDGNAVTQREAIKYLNNIAEEEN